MIPFATNAGWLGSTFDEIKGLCKGNMKKKMSIQFGTNHLENKLITSNKDIEKWMDIMKEER